MNEILQTILVVVGFTAVLTYFSHRQKQSSWIGQVIDKKYYEAESDEDGFSPEKYVVTFKTDVGKKVKIILSKAEYEKYQIGDKVIKNKGDYFPTKC